MSPWAQGSPRRLLIVVFALGLGTSVVLNNDSAVLLVVPIVVTLVRQLYPGRNDIVAWFALVVFMAAGVAPLMVSNPMNLIVAEYAGMSFNSYAARMLPVAVAGWVVAFTVLRFAGRAVPAAMGPATPPTAARPRWTAAQLRALALVLGILVAYPTASYLGIAVWVVAVAGAALAALLCVRHGVGSYMDIVRRDIAWEVLVFLAGMFVVAIGLRNAGVVDALERLYDHANLAVIGATSAVGSALINNHPMGLLNLLAIDPSPGGDHQPILAALVGGDLGPRLLPTGSLAGVLLYATLRRLEVRSAPAPVLCRGRPRHDPDPRGLTHRPRPHACSGGGTRTHNLRINSPPLCQLSYPGVSRGSLPTGPDWTRLTSCGSGPVSWSAG